MNFLLLIVLILHFLFSYCFFQLIDGSSRFTLQNNSIYILFITSQFRQKIYKSSTLYSQMKMVFLQMKYFLYSDLLLYNKSFFSNFISDHIHIYQFIQLIITKMNFLTKNLKFMVGLHSKKLVESAMILRPQHKRYVNLHPIKVEKYIKTTQAPEPLAFKIHKSSQQVSFDLPHPKPLGTLQALPFNVERSLSGNFPVYVDYKSRRNIKRTIIRKISGDVQKLANELRKVCSNAEIRVKVGKIVIPGIHKESVNMLLYKLGL